jgi:hypothetical protein
VSDAEGPRYVIASVPLDRLLDLITGRLRITNLPATAKLSAAWLDGFAIDGEEPPVSRLMLRIEDDSFPEVTNRFRELPRLKLRATRR